MTKIYIKSCIDCGKTFKAHANNAKRCDECKQELAREKAREQNALRKRENLYKKARKTKPKKTLSEIMRELEAYNKEHGTHLTYGQYVSKAGNETH